MAEALVMDTKPLTAPQPLTLLIADDMSRVNLDAVKRAVEMFESVHARPVVLSPIFSPPPIPLEFAGLPTTSDDLAFGRSFMDYGPRRYIDVIWLNDDEKRRQRNQRKQRSRTRRGK
jgi:hypothetical protein